MRHSQANIYLTLPGLGLEWLQLIPISDTYSPNKTHCFKHYFLFTPYDILYQPPSLSPNKIVSTSTSHDVTQQISLQTTRHRSTMSLKIPPKLYCSCNLWTWALKVTFSIAGPLPEEKEVPTILFCGGVFSMSWMAVKWEYLARDMGFRV